MTYRYFKTLIWARKNFASMNTFSDYSGSKMIFSKIHQMAYWYSKTLILAQKKICNCGRPTIVIVDLLTMEGRK